MAIATHTLATLIQKLAESCSDWLSFSTTTNLTTDNYVISTTLSEYDESEDNHFGGADTEWWVYITGTANVGIVRRTSDYSAASTRITIEGAALAAESAAATCQLFRYNRTAYKKAIIEACTEVYDSLYLPVEDITLITGNILPDASFEDWSASTTLTWYSVVTGALAQTSAAGSTRNGKYSAKFTDSTAAGYFYVSSKTYPRLLDLQGQTVDLYCWAYPEVADDATMSIYTINAAGSTQTLPTTTANPATTWTMLKLESQVLNDDLVEVQVRFNVATNLKYVIFDDAMVQGRNIYEYLLPEKIRDGNLDNLYMQTSGNYDPACYDYHPFSTLNPGRELPFDIVDNATDRYVKVGSTLPTERRLRLLGKTPLETLSAETDTITLDAWRVPRLINKARMIFWEREVMPISSQDKSRFDFEYAKAERDYRKSSRLSMPQSARKIRI